MAGTTVTYEDPTSINFANPAGNSKLKNIILTNNINYIHRFKNLLIKNNENRNSK